jgi:hypothetical protein
VCRARCARRSACALQASVDYLGKRSEESSGSDDQQKAEKLLRKRIEECGKGRRIDPTAEHRVRTEELFQALEKDYANNQRRSAEMLAYRLTPLRETFGQMKALDVNAAGSRGT